MVARGLGSCSGILLESSLGGCRSVLGRAWSFSL